ncbi:MAG: hypothetical protein JSV33_04565 [bacterium]|nr:MAG: hypothetical protein JSV33_04565 [bacterium]
MIERHLEAIRSKEEKARSLIREAEGRAAEILDAAREAGEREIDDVRVEAAELERSLMARAREKAEETISGLRAENARKVASLSVLVKRNREPALDLIIDMFRKGL